MRSILNSSIEATYCCAFLVRIFVKDSADNDEITIGQLITDQFDKATLEAFLTVQFTHHYEILRRSESINERLFYIRRVASEFWSVDKLNPKIRKQSQ